MSDQRSYIISPQNRLFNPGFQGSLNYDFGQKWVK